MVGALGHQPVASRPSVRDASQPTNLYPAPINSTSSSEASRPPSCFLLGTRGDHESQDRALQPRPDRFFWTTTSALGSSTIAILRQRDRGWWGDPKTARSPAQPCLAWPRDRPTGRRPDSGNSDKSVGGDGNTTKLSVDAGAKRGHLRGETHCVSLGIPLAPIAPMRNRTRGGRRR